jgi:trehalose 6-phosphate phosphatase
MIPARHLFACWSSVSERLREARRVALFLDFDGTLTPLRPRPEDVRLSTHMRRVISMLKRNPRFRVVVISGRRQADVRARMRIPGVRYLGLQGWEGREGFRSSAIPEETRKLLELLKWQARQVVRETPSAWLEDKGMVMTIHHAEASEKDVLRIRAEMASAMESVNGRFRTMAGERSFELAPAALEDKGVAALREWGSVSRAALPVFIGDDVMDEPAFAALAQGITVRVGRPASTHAHYRLSDVTEVRAFLERLTNVGQPIMAAAAF